MGVPAFLPYDVGRSMFDVQFEKRSPQEVRPARNALIAA
jgi:hypothetical protein